MVNKESIAELKVLLDYVSKFQVKDIDDLHALYRMQFDQAKLQLMILEPTLLDGVMRFFSIGILTRIEELLEEKQRKSELN